MLAKGIESTELRLEVFVYNKKSLFLVRDLAIYKHKAKMFSIVFMLTNFSKERNIHTYDQQCTWVFSLQTDIYYYQYPAK